MGLFHVKMAFFCVFILLCGMPEVYAQESRDEKHIEVSLRMIGHEILLATGDKSSRVLPIEQHENHYTIRFENDFVLNPDQLLKTVNRVLLETQLASGYFVEVRACSSDSVVYSYEIGNAAQPDLIPCQSREYPKACYSLDFTFYGLPVKVEQKSTEDSASIPLLYMLPAACLVVIILGWVWMRKRKIRRDDPNVIQMGSYQFKVLSGELKHGGKRIELTSKEADLLLLLHGSLNATVERETILHRVWGDEGDYIGRTLDVFISKLRKKLELDASVKIVNVRGVGYKLRIEE